MLTSMDFSAQNAYSVLQLALESASASFRGALKQVREVFSRPLTSGEQRLGEQEEGEDEDDVYDFKTRMNINEAAIAVARGAEKLVDVVRHALTFRDVLIEKEDNIDRKLGAIVAQNHSLMEENDELADKLRRARKEISEMRQSDATPNLSLDTSEEPSLTILPPRAGGGGSLTSSVEQLPRSAERKGAAAGQLGLEGTNLLLQMN